MLSKKSFNTVAEVLATVTFDRYCKELDKVFQDAFNKAFEGERISFERKKRIGDKFLNELHEVK